MRFASFDDAWLWFAGGGALVAADDQREHFASGRGQFLGFIARITERRALEAIARWQDALADIDALRFVAEDDLHITLRPVGFQVIAKRRADEVLRQDVGGIAEQAARVLRGVKRIDTTLGPPNVFPDALVLQVADAGALAALHDALPGAELQGEPVPYLPHVTIAAFASPGAAAPLRERLPALRDAAAVPMQIRRVELARQWFVEDDGADGTGAGIETVRSYRL